MKTSKRIIFTCILIGLSIIITGCMGLSEVEKAKVKNFLSKNPGISAEAKNKLLQASSFKAVKYDIDYINRNSYRLTSQEKSGLILDKVWKGMTKEDVRHSWGDPDSKYKSGNYETWTYENSDYSEYSSYYHSYTLIFINNILQDWDEYESN